LRTRRLKLIFCDDENDVDWIPTLNSTGRSESFVKPAIFSTPEDAFLQKTDEEILEPVDKLKP
jgi:hypothetical protein